MLDLAEVTALITREAMLLDRRCWREWLDLYSEDSVFWMPAWLDEDTTTSDPDAELSHIYYKGRHNLEDRVWRATSGMSVASDILARVCHQITNIIVEGPDSATAAFCSHIYEPKRQRQRSLFGRYDYQFVSQAGELRIAAKTITLMNDRIETVADFYMV